MSSSPSWQARRLSFGAGADAYERYRPGYPADAVRFAVGPAPARVVDVGAGTGKLAVAVSALGHEVVAVEPDDAMRAVAERSLPGRTLAGHAEAIPLPDASVDVVVAGQAFHWFDRGAALPEIARVLRPGGAFAILWNIRDGGVDWVHALSRVIGGEDRVRQAERLRPPDLGPLFTHAEAGVFTVEQTLDAESLVGLVGSFSYVFLRPDAADVLAAVRRLAAGHPDLAGRDAFALPYETRVFRARLAAR